MSANPDIQEPEARAGTLARLIDGLDDEANVDGVVGVGREGVERWSRGDLGGTVGRLARGLAEELGMRAGDRALLLERNSPEWIVCALATVAAGGVPVPLDVQLGDEPLRGILAGSRARFAFAGQGQLERLGRLASGSAPRGVRLGSAEAGGGRAGVPHWHDLLADSRLAPRTPRATDTAVLFYTSGTTGPPKGVPLSHRNVVFQLDSLDGLGIIERGDRVLLPLPLHHVYPFVVGMLAPLSLRLPLILPRSLTGPQIRRAMVTGRATAVIGVPELYSTLEAFIDAQIGSRGAAVGAGFRGLRAGSQWLRRRFGLRAGRWLLAPLHRRMGVPLRLLASGGAALPEALAWRLQAYGWDVATGYGLTETAPLLTVNVPGASRFASAGCPVPGVELRISEPRCDDPEARPAELEPGWGEVLARGPGVFDGYLELPEKTEAAFEDGWFRTGDLGRIDDDGYLHLAGRVSTLIVTPAGENVQPDDVEEAYAAHPFLKEVGVLQHDGRLVAVVLPDPRQARDLDPDALAQRVARAMAERARALPSYKQVEDWVIAREPLARTRLGKLQRHRLGPRYEALKTARVEIPGESVRPTPVESMAPQDRELLQEPAARRVWQLLAERYPDRPLDPDSRLRRDLGIDSMDWLRLGLEIRDRAGVELADEAIPGLETVHDVLEQVTVAGSAAGARSPLTEPEAMLGEADRRWLRPLGPAATRASRAMYALDRGLIRGLFRLRGGGRRARP